MNPIAFTIKGYDIRWYSIFILLAVIVTLWVIEREAKRLGVRKDYIFNMMFSAFLFGVVGARLYYVIFNMDLT